MTPLRNRMLEELQLRNYADFTVERYLDAVQRFAKHFGKPPDQLGAEQIRDYLLHLVKDRKARSFPIFLVPERFHASLHETR